MLRCLILIQLIFLFCSSTLHSQSSTENIVIITLDGLRWQEVFFGADEELINNPLYTRDPKKVMQMFWDSIPERRREKLMPFLWGTIKSQGAIYGNRHEGNFVENANPHKFSYPGYHELFTGFPDSLIDSNDKKYNPHQTVLEYLHNTKNYKNKVAAFCTWDVFPYILNKNTNGIYINSDNDLLPAINKEFAIINEFQELSPRPLGVRPDVITFIAAKEYIKNYKPKIIFIGLDETDDLAHASRYDDYLTTIKSQDKMIASLWSMIQSMKEYKGKTTLLLTTDHGRGDAIKKDWTSHGKRVGDSHQMWFSIMGPSVKNTGEQKNNQTIYQAQFAATIAELVGYQFKPNHPIYPSIKF